MGETRLLKSRFEKFPAFSNFFFLKFKKFPAFSIFFFLKFKKSPAFFENLQGNYFFLKYNIMSIRFIRGPKNYKYTAIIGNRSDESIEGRRVNFGDKRYEQYHDKIGLYSNLDHNDKIRRANYRKRHSAIRKKDGKRAVDVKYSPAWFSYRYLW